MMSIGANLGGIKNRNGRWGKQVKAGMGQGLEEGKKLDKSLGGGRGVANREVCVS